MRSKRLAAFLVLASAGVLTFQAEVQARHRQRCCSTVVCYCEPEQVAFKAEYLTVISTPLKAIMFDLQGGLITSGTATFPFKDVVSNVDITLTGAGVSINSTTGVATGTYDASKLSPGGLMSVTITHG